MTNQERIQSHNTRLAAMKETIAGLPETGGEVAVETNAITVIVRGRYTYGDAMNIVYADKNGIFRTVQLPYSSGTYSFDCAKDGIMLFYEIGLASSVSIEGDMWLVADDTNSSNQVYEYYGDATITIQY